MGQMCTECIYTDKDNFCIALGLPSENVLDEDCDYFQPCIVVEDSDEID